MYRKTGLELYLRVRARVRVRAKVSVTLFYKLFYHFIIFLVSRCVFVFFLTID